MPERADEPSALRARLAALDAERAEEVARAGAAIAELERRTYWLDRWELDLDELARTPAGRLIDRAFAARRRLRWMRERRRARGG
ncbi:MAG: hypothetical protein ACR2LY_08910 [Thermoleophilaceae bacterium]